MNHNFLTATRLHKYQEQGFLTIKNFASPETCQQLMSRADQIVHKLKKEWRKATFSTEKQTQTTNNYFLDSAHKISVFMEEGVDPAQHQDNHIANKLGHVLHKYDPIFQAYTQTHGVIDIAQELGLSKPEIIQSMYIFKQPKVGGKVNIHQDASFLYTDPITVTGFWLALQDATIENGCLWAYPKGHRQQLRKRFVIDDDGQSEFVTLDTTPLPQTGYIPLEVAAGTLVILHGLLPHYSLPNHSDKSRQAYTLHLIDAQAHYPSDNWLRK